MGGERLLEEDDEYDNPFGDDDRWGDEKGQSSKGEAFPSEWKEGNAWVKCRLISPTGMDSETTIPTLSSGQGQMINILLMRLAANLPVEIAFQGDDGKVIYTDESPDPIVMK